MGVLYNMTEKAFVEKYHRENIEDIQKRFYKVPYCFFHGFEYQGLRRAGGAKFTGLFIDLYFDLVDKKRFVIYGKGSLKEFATKYEGLMGSDFDNFLNYCLENSLLVEENTNTLQKDYFMPMAYVYLTNIEERMKSFAERGRMGAEAKKAKKEQAPTSYEGNQNSQYDIEPPF